MSASWLKRVALIQPTKMRLWTLLLLLWATRLLAEPAHPPLVPQGEVIPNALAVVDDIFPRTGVNAVAYSPDGKVLASAWAERRCAPV